MFGFFYSGKILERAEFNLNSSTGEFFKSSKLGKYLQQAFISALATVGEDCVGELTAA